MRKWTWTSYNHVGSYIVIVYITCLQTLLFSIWPCNSFKGFGCSGHFFTYFTIEFFIVNFFIFYTKATIVWHVLFTSPSLLWKCYKISRNSCTNDSRATLSIIVVIFFTVVHIYVRRAYIYIHFTHKYILTFILYV